MKKILIGTVTINRDVEMCNTQFQYAASFERLMVKKGEYPIYTYTDELKANGTEVGSGNYIGYEGAVIAGNVGGKPGEHTTYHAMIYGYMLAHDFLHGYSYRDGVKYTYELRPEWTIKVCDFVSDFDNRRIFMLDIVLRDGEKPCYMD